MNNKQHIEGFIQQHLPEFDTVTPQECLWKNISSTLDRLPKGDALEHFIAVNRPSLDSNCPETAIWARIEQSLSPLHNAPHTPNDDLETFIQAHRSEFDTDTPDLRIWNQLAVATTAPAIRIVWYRRLARVAAAIALLVTGAGMGLWYANNQPEEAYVGMKMSEVSKEYADIEQQYERDIKEKKAQLARFASNPGTSEVLGDMEQMDKVMEELRIELSNVPPGNREQIIRIMIENYQSKAFVLKKVLEAMQTQQDFPANEGGQQQTQYYDQDTI